MEINVGVNQFFPVVSCYESWSIGPVAYDDYIQQAFTNKLNALILNRHANFPSSENWESIHAGFKFCLLLEDPLRVLVVGCANALV